MSSKDLPARIGILAEYLATGETVQVERGSFRIGARDRLMVRLHSADNNQPIWVGYTLQGFTGRLSAPSWLPGGKG